MEANPEHPLKRSGEQTLIESNNSKFWIFFNFQSSAIPLEIDRLREGNCFCPLAVPWMVTTLGGAGFHFLSGILCCRDQASLSRALGLPWSLYASLFIF